MTDKSNYINEVSLRYANALILISKKSGLKQIQNDFESFIKLIETNKDIISIPITTPKITKSIGLITLKKEPNTPLVSALLNDLKKFK